MKKKVVAILSILLAVMLLTGCWNYRGLDEMSIVAGMAIDFDDDANAYSVTFEIVDMTGNVKEEGILAMVLESKGDTLFDAVRNAKRRIVNKIYLGHMETVIISEKVARTIDISDIIDFLLRDGEVRETLVVVVSQEPCACDLITIEGIGHPLVSFEIKKIITADNKITSSIPFMQLFNIYDTLHTDGLEVVLPAFHNADNVGDPASEANGTAVFRGERLIGFLTPDQSEYFLFIMNKVEGGTLTCSISGDKPDTTLEIKGCHTQRSFAYKNGRLTMALKIETDTYLDEANAPMDSQDEGQIHELEMRASEALLNRIADTIGVVQRYGSDIFGFGDTIHQQDPLLWNMLKNQWDTVFPSLEVSVECKVNIMNTARLKKN